MRDAIDGGGGNAPGSSTKTLEMIARRAFTSLMGEGVHEYIYFTRATVSGDYIVPPAPRAEEMYMPETYGSSRTDRVVVE